MDMFDEEILNEFVIEANELLSSAEEDIIELETTTDKETVNRIFRAFHTIKGNAAMIGLKNLSFLAHRAEDTLTKVRNETLKPNKIMIDLLLKVIDSLKSMIDDTKAGVETDLDVSGLVSKLEGLSVEDNIETKGVEEYVSPETLAPAPALEVVEKEIETIKEPTETLIPDRKPRTPETGNLKILVAEDDYTSRKVIKLILNKYGQVDAVVNGEEAVDAFKYAYKETPTNPYDLVCMDIMMPELDGMEAVKQIRSFEKEQGVPLTDEALIIMTTALDDPKTVIRSLYKCGATAYLVKPVQKEDLEKELRKFALI